MQIGYRRASSIPREPNGKDYVLYRYMGHKVGVKKFDVIARTGGLVYLKDGTTVNDMAMYKTREAAENAGKRSLARRSSEERGRPRRSP